MTLKAPDNIKQQLQNAESTINNMAMPNNISNIIGNTTLNLFNILSTIPGGGKELVIDEDTQRLVDNIASRFPDLLTDADSAIRAKDATIQA